MKKIYLLLLIFSSALLNASGQFAYITSLTIGPPNPTPTDTIRLFIQCDFSHSPCDGEAFMNGITDTIINTGGLNCLGDDIIPCTAYDTLVMDPLPPATYNLQYLLVTGVTAGCIPSIVPLVFDSMQFTVSPATGIYPMSDQKKTLLVMPNPTRGKFTIRQIEEEKSLLQVFSAEGMLVKSLFITGHETEVDSDLPAGVYTVLKESNGRRSFSKLVVAR